MGHRCRRVTFLASRALGALAVLASPCLPAPASPPPTPAPPQTAIDIVRDVHGVPHVYAPNDNAAFFGMGYATAEDRLFQMEFGRRVMRGTLSEILPANNYPKALLLDKRARYLGWTDHAADAAAGILASDPTVYGFLRSYTGGINRKLRELRASGAWPPMFAAVGLTDMQDWSVADCLLAWWRIQQLFDGDISAEATNELSGGCASTQVIDVDGAIVQHSWSAPLCLEDLTDRTRTYHGWTPNDFLKASHNLAVHGSQTLSGLPLMLAKPQFQVSAPNVFYEINLRGSSIASRGVAFAGCPGFLVGWNEDIAWSFTSMGGDMRDLYRLTIPAGPVDTYLLDGQNVAMTDVHDETIHVLGQADVIVKHRKSVWGPVVTDFVYEEAPILPQPAGEGWAYRSVALDDTTQHSVRALIGLMRADDWCEARDAMRQWRGPGAHWLYAGDDGHIGYTAAVVLPVRPPSAPCGGHHPLDGSNSASAWLPPVAFDNLPWDLDPSQGFLSTANNLSADPEPAWNDIVLGPYGDTDRSWRLRELLTRLVTTVIVTPTELLTLNVDSVNPVMRATGKLADYAFQIGFPFSPSVQAYAQVLATWSCDTPASGCWELNTSHPDLVELWRIQGSLGRIGTAAHLAPLVAAFGDGGAGVCNMLKTAEAMGMPAFVAAYPEALAWLNDRLGLAVVNPKSPNHPALLNYHWNVQTDLFVPPVFGLHHAGPFPVALDNIFSSTVWSQIGESYVFLADLANVDGNLALCPPGVSEDPANPTFFAHVGAWQAGMPYSAPISRTAVEAQGLFTVTTIVIP
jgi:acyl-homoserine lactone acylase PvdQ